jgi:long-subunit acyl-CoA synthetase (AMP-forming)
MGDRNEFGDIGLFYGNGNVYVIGRKRICIGGDWGFTAERLEKELGKDYFVGSEVIVGIGEKVTPERAVKLLHKVIRLIKKPASP